MIRTSLFACVLALVACKAKSGSTDQGPGSSAKPGSAASGSATGSAADSGSSSTEPTPPLPTEPVKTPTGTAPKLVWTDTEGEIMLATSDGKTLEGPCGMAGTITPTEVAIASGKEAWNVILREGRRYSFPKLDWVIEVKPNGDIVHSRGGTHTPLGKATGADSDEALVWFAAFIAAAPMIQHQLAAESLDGKYKLAITGPADMRSWNIVDGAQARVASRMRDDPGPLLAPGVEAEIRPHKINITRAKDGPYTVELERTPDDSKQPVPPETFQVSEAPDGTLSRADGKKQVPFAKLVGRQKCKAHDVAAQELVRALFATKVGHANVKAPPAARKPDKAKGSPSLRGGK